MKKEQLQKIKYIYEERDQLARKIEQLETMRTSPRTSVYGSERVRSSTNGDIQADNLTRLEELIRAYNRKLRELISITTEFESALTNLNARDRVIIRKHYLDGMTWSAIQEDMELSESTLYRVSRRAIKKIISK